MIAAARQERVQYFRMLADRENRLELRRREPPNRWRKDFAETPEQADLLAHQRILAGAEVWVGMVPRVVYHGILCEKEYAPSRVLWADHDSARSVAKRDGFEPEPSAVVHSGGLDGDVPRCYSIWALTEPLGPDEVKRHNKRLAHHLEADGNVCDAARILRVPGSRHKSGRVCQLVRFTGEVYSLDELTGDLEDAPDWRPPEEKPKPKTGDELIDLFVSTQLGEKDGRHEAYRSVAGVLLRYCDRLPPDVLAELSFCWAERHFQPCRDRGELERQFDNLLDRERKRRGIA